MDLKFVKLMVESFYNDTPEVKKLYNTRQDYLDDIYEEIKTILTTFRLESAPEYFDLYSNYDKGQQQNILYHLIEMSLYDRFPEQFPLYENNYDELYDKLLLEGWALPAAALGTVLIGVLWGSTGVSKVKWGALTKFNELNEKIHKFVKDHTQSDRVRLTLAFNNAEECYKKCGINDKSDMSMRLGSSFRVRNEKESLLRFQTGKSQEQAYCLTNCYLKWSLTQLETLLSGYIGCLRQTGERGNDLNDIKLLISNAPASAICKPYFELVKKHKAMFDDVVETVAKDSMEAEQYQRMYSDIVNKCLNGNNRINTDHNSYNLSRDTFQRS